MGQAISEFLLRAHTAGLGHDAVIEIMVALLGVMVAVLAFIGFVMSVGLAAIGLFGFQSIKEEAKKSAEAIAKKVATDIAKETLDVSRERAQASALSETQAEGIPSRSTTSTKHKESLRNKAETDIQLTKDERTEAL